MSACPVIHKVTDDSPFGKGGKCPFGHNDSGLGDFADKLDEDSYKKLCKVMQQITAFYENGTNMKKDHYELATIELGKLDLDKEMCDKQLEALSTTDALKEHPKSKAYRKKLEKEMDSFADQRTLFVSKQTEAYDLWQWSTVIVKVCKWLQHSCDFHCNDKLNLGLTLEPLPVLTEDEIEKYGRGLDEISFNLQESQDFFKASVDGRLKQYHEVEKTVIEAQLEILSKYEEDNERKMVWEQELMMDLEYVHGNLAEDDGRQDRRKKMLQNHAAFLAVLKYHKEKLEHPFKSDPNRQYDPKFDFNPAAVIAEHGSA